MAADPEILSGIPLFQALDDDERKAVAALMHETKVPAGTTLFRESDPGGVFYIIRGGQIELSMLDEDRKKVVVGLLGAGEFFGEVSLLDEGGRSATAAAVEDTEAFSLERLPFLDLLRRRPDLAIDILGAFAKRFRKTDELLRQRVPNPNAVVEQQETFGERVADAVARFGGSWRFIFSFAGLLFSWVFINTVLILHRGPTGESFDPYPFILLNLILSMLAAIQAPVIMMSQNRQDAKDRIKSDLEYQVNLKAELEIMQLHEKFDDLRREILGRTRH
jgi:uncharacterized membrane protein